MPTRDLTLADIIVSPRFDLDEVEEVTRRLGAAVLPGYVGEATLVALRSEFAALFDDDSDYVYKINYEPGRALSLINNERFGSRYPAIAAFFGDPKMVDLAHRYVGVPCLPNHEIYATHEYIPGASVAPTHFDKLWTLKFMLYLENVAPGSAPFGVVPGSLVRSRAIFRGIYEENNLTELSMNDDLYQKMNNADPDLDGDVVDITGPAGTLIVFDTDTYHHASPVAAGCERKILRGHSGPYAQYSRVRKHSRQWWRGEKAYTRLDQLRDKLLRRV